MKPADEALFLMRSMKKMMKPTYLFVSLEEIFKKGGTMNMFKTVLVLSVLFSSAVSSAAATFRYVGQFNGVAGVLTLQQTGQTYTASFTGNNGQRGLLKDCESTIGSLQKYKEKNGQLRQLIFSFNPNYCISVEGRHVNMDFKGNRVDLTILHKTEKYQPPCYPDWQGKPNCPFPEYESVYFKGRFTAQ